MASDATQFTMTTSWDDGHPLDLRVAELLEKHGIRGTYYIPKENSRPTLSPLQVRELARRFEIGAHTIHHAVLTNLDQGAAQAEIVESKDWVEDVSDRPCLVFCFPSGRYARSHLDMIRKAGFCGARTVEIMSLAHPRMADGIALISTTVQAHAHSLLTCIGNAAKRGRVGGIWNGMAHARGSDWSATAVSLLERARETGGVFHLWGHSWEIEENGQWESLDRVLAAMADCNGAARCVANSELCGARPL